MIVKCRIMKMARECYKKIFDPHFVVAVFIREKTIKKMILNITQDAGSKEYKKA